MKRYSRAELVAFLRHIDSLLTERAVLDVVVRVARNDALQDILQMRFR